jgi:hypothetical protein
LLGLELEDLRTYRDTEASKQEQMRIDFWDSVEESKGTLDLNYYGLQAKGLAALMSSIEDYPDLEELWLRENALTVS